MEREGIQLFVVSKRDRLLTIVIFFLMIISFILHLSVFVDIFFQNNAHQNNRTELPGKKCRFIIIIIIIII